MVIKMTCPDPDGQPNRRRLWVDKTAAVKPATLGITMGTSGNEYDLDPPVEPEPETGRRGPAPVKLEECKEWLTRFLSPHPARIKDIISAAGEGGHTKTTLYAAKESLGLDEYIEGKLKSWSLPGTSETGEDIDGPDEHD